MLGADTRSTSGSTVADKNCEKIHYIADNIRCCGAGTAADTENVTSRSFALDPSPDHCPAKHLRTFSLFHLPLLYTDMVAAALELHRYATGRQSRLITSLTMLKQHLFKWVGTKGAVGSFGERLCQQGFWCSMWCLLVLPEATNKCVLHDGHGHLLGEGHSSINHVCILADGVQVPRPCQRSAGAGWGRHQWATPVHGAHDGRAAAEYSGAGGKA